VTLDRLRLTFARCRNENRAALVTYIMAGDPDLATSARLINALPEAGADILEIGMPFTDPMADGPAIQNAATRALKAGQTLRKTLAMIHAFRATNTDTPIILMGYYNPIYVYGLPDFLRDAVAAGIDGLLLVDVPPEADAEVCLPTREAGLAFVRLATPTTDAARLPAVLAHSSGFVYYVSIAGITGTASANFNSVAQAVANLRAGTDLPIVVGFGVKTPTDVATLAPLADGVVVGSALVQTLADTLDSDGHATASTLEAVLTKVRDLRAATGRL
jgi:tryptophan synthase alpha chain